MTSARPIPATTTPDARASWPKVGPTVWLCANSKNLTGKDPGLEHGLQRLRLVKRVASRDGNVAIGNLSLHGRRRLNNPVKNDDDFAVSGCKTLVACANAAAPSLFNLRLTA